jgi:uncharacterized protein (DUF4415 family)
MKKDKNIRRYTAAELKAKRAQTRTDWRRVDAQTDEELERVIAEDEDEHGIRADWTRAKLVLPRAQKFVHLRLEEEIIDFFKSKGRGHISRMQAVLKVYVDAHSSFERWLITKAKEANESRTFYQLYNATTKEGLACACEMTNGLVKNIAPIENLMEPDSLTQRVGEALILCEQIYLGFKTTIVKSIAEPRNGPTRRQIKNTIRHNIAALRGVSA